VITGAARFFELVTTTAAMIAGVAFVLHAAAKIGAPDLTVSPNAPPTLAELPVRIAFGSPQTGARSIRKAITVPLIDGGPAGFEAGDG
jgi:hypothetical protein